MIDEDTFLMTTLGLAVVSGPSTGTTGEFRTPTVLAGRSQECGFSIDDPTVSRLHFSVSFVRGRWEITDAGSSSGTAVNGALVGDVGTTCVLHDGDRISAGRTVIVVALPSERRDVQPDLEFDPGPSLQMAAPATIRPAGRVAARPLRSWLPWALIALLCIFIAAFVVASC